MESMEDIFSLELNMLIWNVNDFNDQKLLIYISRFIAWISAASSPR